ncbi:hypothetical protein DY000_02042554 [Brassica cretica]|uniref:F-box domain-containing protein n=1 Tax=Brassica cretica TaxID=69181 RepID=A0ABQ7B8W1_BRACR|nr:hypothetical protein DY000_02042554 [Brassica cretica]
MDKTSRTSENGRWLGMTTARVNRKQEDLIVDLHVSLPWELEEDILSRVPPQSLVRFRAVSKRWNSLFNNKSFINNHLFLSRPQFIFLTKSKMYSIDIIDQRINLRKLHSSCGDLNLQYRTITTCDDLLFCKYPPFYSKMETALWNPWLRQANLIKLSVGKDFNVAGLGYDNNRPQKVHKLLLYFPPREVAIYECASHVLRLVSMSSKPLNSLGRFSNPCLLPLQDKPCLCELLLAIWKGDRFSLLKQCYLTRKIEIWVMENKIDDREEVVWINLLTLTAINLPNLFHKKYGVSYFIYDKTLFMCCSDDKDRHPCIYIVKGDVCNKIQMGYGKVDWFSHCAYVPNLISVPLEFQI